MTMEIWVHFQYDIGLISTKQDLHPYPKLKPTIMLKYFDQFFRLKELPFCTQLSCVGYIVLCSSR